MKKSMLLLALLVLVLQTFSQDTTRRELTKADYLQKSKRQKTAGWILLGGGVGMFIAGAATYQIDINLGEFFGSDPAPSHVDNTGSILLTLGGLGAIAGSIVSFLSATHNKKRAAAFTFSNKPIKMLQPTGVAVKMQPTICMHIPL